MTSTATPRANAYGGRCPRCAQWVKPSEGVLVGSRGNWGAAHADGACPAPKAPAAPPRSRTWATTSARTARASRWSRAKRLDDAGNPRRYGLVFTPRPGQRPSWAYVRGAGITVADLTPDDRRGRRGAGPEPRPLHLLLRPARRRDPDRGGDRAHRLRRDLRRNQQLPYPKGVKAQRAYVAEHGK